MTTQERMMEAAKFRFRFQMNNRLRLESLAALSRVFRENEEPIADELLASLVLAVPEELLGEMTPHAAGTGPTNGKRSSDQVATPKAAAQVFTPKSAPVFTPKGMQVFTPKPPVFTPKPPPVSTPKAPVFTPKPPVGTPR